RLAQGYVVILPGIEGHSWFNQWIARGLLQAEVPYAIDIFDWTTGYKGLGLYHLRSRKLQSDSIVVLTEKLVQYRTEYPDQPIYLIGHSGGGAMSVLTLSQLPESVRVNGAVLLGSSVSPWYDVVPALRQSQEGIWNFSSLGDLFFLGLGTTVAGTLDGWHTPSAGMIGFSNAVHRQVEQAGVSPLHEMPYQLKYAKYGNFAGHLGYVTPAFTANVVAPLLMQNAVCQ
ncbi:MAG: alpha/beta hydrolase, partial [Planctomycetaceae bacterium]|nr:alpha/beta hydrolase [Planctomycetaceae bacterium]